MGKGTEDVKLLGITEDNKRAFSSGAVRDSNEGKGRFDLIPSGPMLRLAKRYQEGAKKYEDNNWKKGIPTSSFNDSALRHLFQWMGGDRTEDHLAAVLFNIMGMMYNEDKESN